MRHFIIVKFNDDLSKRAKEEIIENAKNLFAPIIQQAGIKSVIFHTSCIDRPNRYDLMIEITMEKEALCSYDDCEIHHKWKNDFSKFIKSKAIFDCEEF